MNIGDKLDSKLSTIMEGIDDKMPHLVNQLLSKKSRWIGKKIKSDEDRFATAEAIIRSVSDYDPSKNDKYINFLVGQIKNGYITKRKLEEDGPKIQSALETFMSKKKGWPGDNDIMSYGNYRDFLKDASEYEKILEQNPTVTKSGKDRDRERRTVERELRKNAEVVVENGPDIVYGITDAETAALFGRGTQWCTSASPMRTIKKSDDRQLVFDSFKKYYDSNDSSSLSFWPGGLEQVKNDIENSKEIGKIPNAYYMSAIRTCGGYLSHGPLYVMYRNGEPYMQISGHDVMNIDDLPASKVGKQTAQTLIALIKTGKLNDRTKGPMIDLLKNSKKKKMAAV